MIWIYNIFLSLGSLIWVPWMIWRAKRRKEGVDWKERSGDYKIKLQKGVPRLWLHAVSVGEVVAAMPILREVRTLAPDLEIVLSVTTSSGHQTARDKAEGLFDHLVYYPIDVYRFVLAGLVRVRPSVVAIMETELWMNFLDAAHNMGIKTLLVNGRISDRSFPRASKFRFFYHDLLTRMDRCLMQTQTDAERIRKLGGQNIEVFGNCKFDEASDSLNADPVFWRNELGIDPIRPVIVIGSSRGEAEEKLIAEAIIGLDAQFVWAPRHLERVDALKATLVQAGIPVGQRSLGETFASSRLHEDSGFFAEAQSGKVSQGKTLFSPEVLLLDTYGELSEIYCAADIVIVGGGFDNLGGQNLIQPLAHGKPVIQGPHMQNFRDVSEAAKRSGATMVCATSNELRATLDDLIGNPTKRLEMGKAAKELVAKNLGASKRYAEAIVEASRIVIKN